MKAGNPNAARCGDADGYPGLRCRGLRREFSVRYRRTRGKIISSSSLIIKLRRIISRADICMPEGYLRIATEAAAAGYAADGFQLSQAYNFSWTRFLGVSTANEFRASYGRNDFQDGGNSLGDTVPRASNLGDALTFVTFARLKSLLSFGVSHWFAGRAGLQIPTNFMITGLISPDGTPKIGRRCHSGACPHYHAPQLQRFVSIC